MAPIDDLGLPERMLHIVQEDKKRRRSLNASKIMSQIQFTSNNGQIFQSERTTLNSKCSGMLTGTSTHHQGTNSKRRVSIMVFLSESIFVKKIDVAANVIGKAIMKHLSNLANNYIFKLNKKNHIS